MMLFLLLSWPYLRRHALRWALTLAGIALGVGVFVAIHTANRSTFHAFETTVNRIAGATQLQVTSGEFGFEEAVMERVQSVPQVAIAVPVIESTVETRVGSQGNILLLGVDMTGDRNLRKYDLEDADQAIDDPLVFLAQPDSLLVTKEFAQRNAIGVSSRIPLITVQGERDFIVRGIMQSEGMARAFGGDLAIMDIYAAQRVLGKGRRFDRIDLRAKDGVSIEECKAAVLAVLGPGFEVETPAARGQQFEALLHGYSLALEVASLFAVIVGMFIIYNSFAIALTHRRSEIGILRAIGATRAQIQKMFLLESALAGALGSTLGAVLGLAGSMAIARYMSVVVEEVGGVAPQVTELEIDPAIIAAGILIGIATSIVAAWIPARDAARVDPVRALQKGKYQALFAGENRRRRSLAYVFAMAASVCLLLPKFNSVFYAGYILMVLAGLLLAPSLTLLLSRAVRPILKRVFPVEGTLAADSLVQAPRRTSATVSALMLSLAMVVGFGGFARSFYTAVDEWSEHVLNADFFVSPTANLTTHSLTFPAAVGTILQNVGGVDQVQLVRNARVLFRSHPVLVVAIETRKEAQTTRPIPVEGSLEEMYRLTAQGKGLIASENFMLLQKMKPGDVVDLPTPSGLLSLPIVGVIRSYSDVQGSVVIDRSVYLKWWKDDTANLARVYVRPGLSSTDVRAQIVQAMSGRQHLLVLTNRDVREWITKILDQWFALTYTEVAVAILVAMLGIINTLTVSITDRRRELGVMRALGGLRSQIRRTIWMEAIGIGAIGLMLGIALGAINLYYTLGMIQRSDFGGLHLDYDFPVSLSVFMIPTILVTALVAAVAPGEAALRGSLVQALEYE